MAADAAENSLKRQAFVKRAGAVVGLLIALGTILLGVGGWYTDRVKAEVTHEVEEQSIEDRLTNEEIRTVNQGQELKDLKNLHRLERVRDVRVETMVEMVLKGQGQEPPIITEDVKGVDKEIAEILAK